MRTVNMHEAKSRLSALVEAVENGREVEVILSRNGKPAARLVPLAKPDVSRRIGVAKGQFAVPSDESWKAMDEEIKRMFLDALAEEELPDAAE